MTRNEDETRMARGLFYKGVALGATVAIVLLGAQAAFAGTGLGAVFNLGRTNTVGATSTLTGTTGGAQLQVTNKATGTAATGVSITVDPRRAPLRVNSKTVVPNLNSNFLQGKRAADFLGVSATAANSASLGGKPASAYLLTTGTAANSTKLGGKTADDFLLATGTAADADKLGGVAASEYVSGCPLYGDPATRGSVAARVIVGQQQQPSSNLSANGATAAWTCSGGPIWVQRIDVGFYCVVVDPTVVTEFEGTTYAGLPLASDRVVPLVSAAGTRVASVGSTLDICGPGAGIPGMTQYLGFLVNTRDTAGAFADASFTFALV